MTRFNTTVFLIHTIIEVQLVAMIALHTLAWPYQKKIHNIIDLLLFANLAIINSLKLLKFFYIENGTKSRRDLKRIRLTAAFFTYIPIIALCLVLLYKLVRILKYLLAKISQASNKLHVEQEERSIRLENLDHNLLEDDQRSLHASESYHKMKINT
jgi:hypothetical protein